MEAWNALPDAPLGGGGTECAAFRALGCARYHEAARLVHELPYGRNADRADYRLVLPERRGTCSTKHALLAAVARELALPVSLTIGIYDLCEANTPGVGGVLAAHGLASLPEAHCYLRAGRHRIDVTRAGVAQAEPISRFHLEESIAPDQIGDYKVALHRRFLRRWLAERPELALSLDALWSIREACIHALDAR